MSVDDERPCHDIQSDGDIDEVCIRNPLTAKAKRVINANITRHWDTKSKKGKEKRKAEISSSKGAKKKGLNSQDAANTRETNYIQSQHSNFTQSQYPFAYSQFQPSFGHNQFFFQHGGHHSSQGNDHGCAPW